MQITFEFPVALESEISNTDVSELVRVMNGWNVLGVEFNEKHGIGVAIICRDVPMELTKEALIGIAHAIRTSYESFMRSGLPLSENN